MTALHVTSPRQMALYHGTTVSHSTMIPPTEGNVLRRKAAFATEDEDVAWTYAAQNRAGMLGESRRGGRARVYTTSTTHDSELGQFHEQHPHHTGDRSNAEHVSGTGFPIHGRIDTMPGRQGTFPQIDWNRHLSEPIAGDANHPDEHERQWGHRLEVTPANHSTPVEPHPGQGVLPLVLGRPRASRADLRGSFR